MGSVGHVLRSDTDGRLRAGWRIVAIVVSALVATQAVALASGEWLAQPWSFLVGGVLMAAVALAVVWLLGRRLDVLPWEVVSAADRRSAAE